MKNYIIIFIWLFLVFTFASCSRERKIEEDIGIHCDIVLQGPLCEDSFIIAGYEWLFPSPKIAFREDMRVFVHFWSIDQRRMILQDDHRLNLPESGWDNTDRLSYSRRVFIPEFISDLKILDQNMRAQERIRINAGLYDPNDEDFNVLLYNMTHTFSNLPQRYPKIVFHEGWNNPERVAGNPDKTLIWTKDKAVLIVENIETDIELHLKGTVFKHIYPDQSISLFFNDHLLDEFIPDEAHFYRCYIIPLDLIGNEKDYKFQILTNKTFIPAEMGIDEDDDRELGIMINSMIFSRLEKSVLPYIYPKTVFYEGWHEREKALDYPNHFFIWTKEAGTLIIENPYSDLEMHIKGNVMKHIHPDQKISIRIDDSLIDEFIPNEGEFYKVYIIPQDMIEDRNEFYCHISTDRTFTPAEIGMDENDERELGIMVNFIYINVL